jgi:hypothetical protein
VKKKIMDPFSLKHSDTVFKSSERGSRSKSGAAPQL